jgi:predicted dehydrogenase
MPETSLRLGLVGCGYQGRLLAAAVARTPGTRLVACADRDEAALSGAAALAPGASRHP